MRLSAAILIILFTNHVAGAIDETDWPRLSGPYLGQTPPEMVVELFADGLISTPGSEINAAFTPDGQEFYYTAWEPDTGTRIMVSRLLDGAWSKPEKATFSTHPTDVDPAVTPDGQRLIFGSRRPPPGTDEGDGFNMWYVRRQAQGWSEAEYMGPTVNSGSSQVYATSTRDHTIYFQAVREDGFGKADIYRARLADGHYLPPENLGSAINSPFYEGDVFVAPDESYLIVTVYGRADGFGEGDLYVSFPGPDGDWLPLRNMGDVINTKAREFCPMVTPDGKYLFFTSKRRGEGDIFWIDAGIIDSLKSQ